MYDLLGTVFTHYKDECEKNRENKESVMQQLPPMPNIRKAQQRVQTDVEM